MKLDFTKMRNINFMTLNPSPHGSLMQNAIKWRWGLRLQWAYNPINPKELFPHHERETLVRVEDLGAKSQKRNQGSVKLTENPQRLKCRLRGLLKASSQIVTAKPTKLGNPKAKPL